MYKSQEIFLFLLWKLCWLFCKQEVPVWCHMYPLAITQHVVFTNIWSMIQTVLSSAPSLTRLQLVKKLQQWSLYEVIEDIMPFVLNTKRPLSVIWLLRYKQNTFGCFRKYSELQFVQKTPKTVLLITQQPNIAQRPVCIQTERQDILYHLI